jgi:hypothetical protein
MTEPADTVDVVGFMDLAGLFRARGWASPHRMALAAPIDGRALLRLLDVPEAAVECLFVNHHAVGVPRALISPGDRVALVPPGVPGPHRYSLGIRQNET